MDPMHHCIEKYNVRSSPGRSPLHITGICPKYALIGYLDIAEWENVFMV
jgi:hypothetical protein